MLEIKAICNHLHNTITPDVKQKREPKTAPSFLPYLIRNRCPHPFQPTVGNFTESDNPAERWRWFASYQQGIPISLCPPL